MQQISALGQPIDRIALGFMFFLALLIVLLVGNGDHSIPKVRDFSWQNRQVGSEDTAFILTFSRPMDQASVESSLRIDPPLPGKFSWAGRRMAYTPLSPVPYGLTYKLKLEGAMDKTAALDYYAGKKSINTIEPFIGNFQSRDRAFVYIGVSGEEIGRLILFNLTQNKKTILTPPDLLVTESRIYPNADKILFTAIPQSLQKQKGINQQLYNVTTGIHFPTANEPTKPPIAAGSVELLLDNQEYNLLKFDLSADGKTIVVQRINRKTPSDIGLWVIPDNSSATPSTQNSMRRLDKPASGEFRITPDSGSIAILQGQGVGISALNSGDSNSGAQSWEFLPKFGRVMDFSKDGTGAAMVKFNTNYTRTLFHVTNQGKEQELIETPGSIIDCQYSPQGETLYCLLTELVTGEKYQEKPYLAIFNVKSSKVRPLLIFPDQRNMQISLSPDGEALLFDSLVTIPPKSDLALRTKDGQEITTGRLWVLPLATIKVDRPDILPQPEQLSLDGYHPIWLP
jgi:hypothetical protein